MQTGFELQNSIPSAVITGMYHCSQLARRIFLEYFEIEAPRVGSPWVSVRREPRAPLSMSPILTVYCVTLACALQRLQENETQASDLEDSEDWLSTHSLKSEKLTLPDLISHGTVEL